MIVANLKEVIGVNVGDTEIKEVWAGDSKVFPDGPTPPAPSGYYYIYRTSSNIIERRDIAQYPKVNFPAIAGNSYGGVFTDYGGKGTVATALANGDPVTFVDDRVQDDGSGYIGESNVSGAAQMFDGNNAITTGTTAYTPTVGAIYYVKENPDWAFDLYAQQIYNRTSPYPLTYYYLITGIDSLAYSSVVYKFKEENQSTFTDINMSMYSSVQPTGMTATLKPYTVFKGKGLFSDNTGWLGVSSNTLNMFEVGKTYICYVEATTLDEVVIHTSYKRSPYVDNLNRSGIVATNMPFDSTLYDSQVEYIETSSTNCSISMGHVASSGYRFEIDAYIPSSADIGWLFGCKAADDTSMYAFELKDKNQLSSYKYHNTISPTTTLPEGRYTFSNMANVNECVVTNGTDTLTFTCSYTSNVANYRLIYALGLNEDGAARPTVKGIKLYSAKLYSSTPSSRILQVDLIPVRKDGRGYLYDKENGTQLLAPKGDPITVYGTDVVE